MKQRLSIDIYFKPATYLPLSVCIEQIEYLLKSQYIYLKMGQNWFLSSSSRKTSSIHKLFDKDGITEEGLKKLTQKYRKENDYFGVPIWDKVY